MPRGKDGKLDHHKALEGDDLKDFVDQKLFPYLKKFKADAESADTIEYIPNAKRNYTFIFKRTSLSLFLAFGNTLFFTKREITFGEGYISFGERPSSEFISLIFGLSMGTHHGERCDTLLPNIFFLCHNGFLF